jgi:hypothetical protein
MEESALRRSSQKPNRHRHKPSSQAIARSQVKVVSCDGPLIRHRNSGGHCFRGNQTPSALKRGFRGKSSPLSAAVPIGTAEHFIISHGVQRKGRERRRTEPRPCLWAESLLPVRAYAAEPPHIALAPDTAVLCVPLLSCTALLPEMSQAPRSRSHVSITARHSGGG